MKVIILAAGYGTRLYPLTKDMPKALLKVAGRTILEHILNRVEEVPDIDKIFIVTNEKFYKSLLEWKEKYKSRIGIEIDAIMFSNRSLNLLKSFESSFERLSEKILRLLKKI